MSRSRAACNLLCLVAGTATAAEGYLDMHVHTAGIGAGGSGAFVGAEMRSDLRFRFYLRAFGVSEEQLEAEGDGLVIRNISTQVAESEQVARAVILAMDGVVADGELDRDATQFYVPNDFVAAEVGRYDNLCFGASVNPQRHDALARLEQAQTDGALLVKWIPNVMHFDPADPAFESFYRKLVELDLPLLSHAGKEQAFPDARDDYGDPRRLELPLSLGVTVIAAHIATTGKNEGEDNFERILPMFDEYPNLYSEISSLTQINKLNYLKRALDVPGLDERLLYGSDYPLQFFPLVSSLWHLRHIEVGTARLVGSIRNQWDRDVALKRAIGTPEHVFARSAELLDVGRCVSVTHRR
ncbi:MAG: amidohydrolase family protein [Gammaproteobacteria bacterium]|nr:amidohydrolase family protein [Gammaproteobacteria bacterium]MDE0442659.1 amidohydrolase family protein [Gammaproteobacteria bacterium]